MIIKIRQRCYDGDTLVVDENVDVKVDSSWYTAQCYFNDTWKQYLVDEHYDRIVLHWQHKIYEFKRKLDGDQRHEEGRA